MLITDKRWAKIRSEFTEPEKVQLRLAMAGQVICPPGVTVDESKLDWLLAEKLRLALGLPAAAG